jgi:hypothetical protein
MWVGSRSSIGPTTRTFQQEPNPAPSVGSIMEGLREPIPSEDTLALAASMEGAAEASMAEAGATDSSHEVIRP